MTFFCIYIYAFSRRFYPKRLTIAFRLYIFISTCVPWESNPQPFAQLTQCSTTEPHRNTEYSCFFYWIFMCNNNEISEKVTSMTRPQFFFKYCAPAHWHLPSLITDDKPGVTRVVGLQAPGLNICKCRIYMRTAVKGNISQRLSDCVCK